MFEYMRRGVTDVRMSSIYVRIQRPRGISPGRSSDMPNDGHNSRMANRTVSILHSESYPLPRDLHRRDNAAPDERILGG